MNKLLPIIMFLVLIVMVACSGNDVEGGSTTNETDGDQNAEVTEETDRKDVESEEKTNEYGIEEVVIADVNQSLDGLPEEKQDFFTSMLGLEEDLLKHIFDKNNIEYKFESHESEDAFVALSNGDVGTITPSSDQQKLTDDKRFAETYAHVELITANEFDESVHENNKSAFAVVKENENLAKLINDNIKEMKENGEYQKLYDKHFDTNEYSVLN